jgi:hypothetical protein
MQPMTTTPPEHPVQLSVDYPDRPLDRVTTAFRILVAVPILIMLGAVPEARGDLNRWLPPVKWSLAIPHYVVLAFLEIAAVVVVIVA